MNIYQIVSWVFFIVLISSPLWVFWLIKRLTIAAWRAPKEDLQEVKEALIKAGMDEKSLVVSEGSLYRITKHGDTSALEKIDISTLKEINL